MINAFFGTDNELMIFGNNGEVMSALDIIPGRKQSPTKIKHGDMQADNVNAELNTIPVQSFDEFVKTWTGVVTETQDYVRNKTGADKAVLRALASYDFPDNLLDNEEARVFGCEPDFNSYTMSLNKAPNCAIAKNLRTAGGHIHIGMDDDVDHEFMVDSFGKVRMVLAMDLFVGLLMTKLDNGPESKRRRTLYGGAGAHRPKIYGVEYRPLSNFWCRDQRLADMTFDLTQEAFKFTADTRYGVTGNANDEVTSLLNKCGPLEVQRAINEADGESAIQIFNSNVYPLINSDLQAKINNILVLSAAGEFNNDVVTDGWSA